MSWRAHKATFRCEAHPRLTARARRGQALEGTAPRCPTCRKPMDLAAEADRRIADRVATS